MLIYIFVTSIKSSYASNRSPSIRTAGPYWTIAVEVPLDLRGAIDLNYEYKTHTLEPHRRRMKPLTRILSLVSRRWNWRVFLPCNGPLWLAAVTLNCLQWHLPVMEQLVEFKKTLLTSFNCDLDVGKL